MMKKISISLILCCCVFSLFAQREDRNWIFGRTNGVNTENVNLDFYSGPGLSLYTVLVPGAMASPPSNIGPTNGFESWSVVSNPTTGNLLFYTDGRSVFDNTHADVTAPLMLGPDGLGASPSSAQPVATCVVPVCPFEQYYVFSNPAGKEGPTPTNGPVIYHIYDEVGGTFAGPFSLPGPHGATNVGEGMLIIPSSDDPYVFFLITRLLNPVGGIAGLTGDSKYVVYRIDPTGISYWSEADFGPGVGTDGTGASPIMNMTYSTNRDPDPFTIGEAEVAFTASRIAAGSDNYVFTCGFNHLSGVGAFIPSSEILVDNFGGEILYDCEYSPLGGFLYYASYFGSNLYQYNFLTNTTYQVGGFGGLRGGGLKLGPDDNIYHIQDAGLISNAGTVQIGRIVSPDVALATNFTGAPSGIYDNTNIISKAQTFAYNFPEFVVTPLWQAEVTIEGNDTICPGEEVILTADIDALGAAIEGYDWYFTSLDGSITDSLLVGGGTFITINQPGIYYLEVDLEGECFIVSLPVVVHEREDCCEITAATANTSYYTNTTISSDLAWDNKVYIADNVIITVDNGATMDITNVDVIFGDCAGIDFINGAKLRSNNSVYRPCDPTAVWRGLHFFRTSPDAENPSGIVNESTFKNAQRALYAYNQLDIDLRVTNNLFSNCKAGVHLSGGNVMRSLSGNTFLVDDLAPDFRNGECAWSSVTEFFGILSDRNTFRELITQNDFVAPDFTQVRFMGIEVRNGSDPAINSNQFTDVFRSIQLVNCNRSLVEANTMRISNSFDNYQHQIVGLRCQNTLIRANEITSTIEQHEGPWLGNNSAIYCSLGRTYAIKENQIAGFEAGIHCERIFSSHIIENDISNGHYYGIYLNGGTSLSTFCNTINMDAQSNGNAIGIAYFQTGDGNRQIEIGSNCIFETNTSIYTSCSSTGGILPRIRNNYMYNYTNAGVENLNFNGDLGTSPSPSLDAGRNTFVTNNGLGITGDIVTNVGLTSFGNFGVSFVSGSVGISGNNVNSTASCGHQIDLANSSIGNMEICDDLRSAIIRLVNSDNQLAAEFEKALPEFNIDEVVYAMNELASNTDEMAIASLYQAANENMDLTVNQQLWLKYHYQLLVKDNEAAEITLSEINPENEDEADLVILERFALKANQLGVAGIDESDIALIHEVYARNAKYAHAAAAVLVEFHALEVYAYYPLKKATHLSTENLVSVGNDHFNVYPNPADDLIMFDFSFSGEKTALIELYDLTGKKITQLTLNQQHGQQTVDVSDLTNGMYLLVVSADGALIGQSKFVKK